MNTSLAERRSFLWARNSLIAFLVAAACFFLVNKVLFSSYYAKGIPRGLSDGLTVDFLGWLLLLSASAACLAPVVFLIFVLKWLRAVRERQNSPSTAVPMDSFPGSR